MIFPTKHPFVVKGIVHCLLWSQEGTIPEDIFNKAMVTSAEEACARAEKIGFPIMVKASEGGRMGFQFCYSMLFLLLLMMMMFHHLSYVWVLIYIYYLII